MSNGRFNVHGNDVADVLVSEGTKAMAHGRPVKNCDVATLEEQRHNLIARLQAADAELTRINKLPLTPSVDIKREAIIRERTAILSELRPLKAKLHDINREGHPGEIQLLQKILVELQGIRKALER